MNWFGYLDTVDWDLLLQHVEDLKVEVHPGKLDVLVLLQDLLVAVNLNRKKLLQTKIPTGILFNPDPK